MNRCWLTNYTYEDYVKDKQKNCNIKGIKEYTPEDILMCREERVCEQEKLIKLYKKTLVFMRVNYPGVVKNNTITLGIMKFMNKFLIEQLNQYIEYKNFAVTAEGPSLTLIVNKNAKDIKKITVNIENKHFLGRYVDIDVYDENNNSLSRGMLGFKPRTCYICSDIAQYCVRSRKHSEEEIKEFIKNKYEDYCKWCKVL
ncbi:citrate lyase holo-[acyl-carrier protein] synthase [Clostridium sp. JS66]|uniref:citrate lyase holo-[acyl-carrier protein] synthase n=1 Tax=Clostridium sp. JS66 TaxID=3064705 RepID=UPI00298E1132|nr:citrate lyase holo-[acyl-carrier protein] synthase [Clostridium sp. JS66]WPC41711.1 citrate lyase holo-[acyl-carrier protein] synthase [Clostridium sp. JS66]